MIFKCEKLSKFYGDKKAVDEVSFTITKGEIIGLIGENGAGKTTLLKMLCGHIKPTDGKMMFDDNLVIGGLIENPGIIPYLIADENLRAKQLFLGKDNAEERIKLLNLVGLKLDKKKVKNFSLGMKQRLGIALAAVGNANFLILDEPLNGLDPTGILEIRELLKKMSVEEEKTVIISSHLLEELSKVATRFLFIKNGKIVYSCDRNSIPENLSLENLYLKYVGGINYEK